MTPAETRIALQLYTVRERSASDFLGTLRAVADVGYRAVELAGYYDVPIDELRTALDEYGLRAVAAHVRLDAWTSDAEQAIADLQTLGCEYAVVPWLPPRCAATPRSPRLGDVVQHLGRVGPRCRACFAYHNHDFEFAQMNGGTMMDVLTTETDPALVGLELDVYWAQFAGYDAVDLLHKYAGRVPLLHVKEMGSGPDRADAPFGEGIIAWEPIFSAADAAGTRWYIVEQDTPQDALADIAVSLRHLEQVLNGGPVDDR
jgi:sugar phosphate isomerase/epimerase